MTVTGTPPLHQYSLFLKQIPFCYHHSTSKKGYYHILNSTWECKNNVTLQTEDVSFKHSCDMSHEVI